MAKKDIIFKTIGEDGSILLTNLPFAGKRVKITIQTGSQRSNPQNRFYFGNFIQAEIDCFKERFGEVYSKDQIHEFNKTNFFGSELFIEETGEVIKMPCSSTVFTKGEWEERLDKARAWFLQNMDWTIGYPLEQTDLVFDR